MGKLFDEDTQRAVDELVDPTVTGLTFIYAKRSVLRDVKTILLNISPPKLVRPYLVTLEDVLETARQEDQPLIRKLITNLEEAHVVDEEQRLERMVTGIPKGTTSIRDMSQEDYKAKRSEIVAAMKVAVAPQMGQFTVPAATKYTGSYEFGMDSKGNYVSWRARLKKFIKDHGIETWPVSSGDSVSRVIDKYPREMFPVLKATLKRLASVGASLEAIKRELQEAGYRTNGRLGTRYEVSVAKTKALRGLRRTTQRELAELQKALINQIDDEDKRLWATVVRDQESRNAEIELLEKLAVATNLIELFATHDLIREEKNMRFAVLWALTKLGNDLQESLKSKTYGDEHLTTYGRGRMISEGMDTLSNRFGKTMNSDDLLDLDTTADLVRATRKYLGDTGDSE